MVVADFFDSGLLGDHFVYMLETAKRKVLAPNASMVPAAATVYCMGIEAYTTEVGPCVCIRIPTMPCWHRGGLEVVGLVFLFVNVSGKPIYIAFVRSARTHASIVALVCRISNTEPDIFTAPYRKMHHLKLVGC